MNLQKTQKDSEDSKFSDQDQTEEILDRALEINRDRPSIPFQKIPRASNEQDRKPQKPSC